MLKKLHEQYRHPRKERLPGLLEDAGKWEKGMEEILDKIDQECTADVCVLPRKRPARPVVALPRARRFNQVVTMDLVLGAKVKPILFLIDWHSRLTVGREIPNKFPESVAKVILKFWVGVGYGAPGCLYSDQGGEFGGKEIQEAARLLGTAASTTAGYSPFSNGLNEKNHGVVQARMAEMQKENPKVSRQEAFHHTS